MDKYEVVKNAIPAEVLKLVKDSLLISKDAAYTQEGSVFRYKVFWRSAMSR
jgi:hypothetical protein